MFFLPTRIPIPPAFYSTETDAPIETCLVCDRALLDTNTEYLVEKAVRQHTEYDVREVIFEYALCLRCHADLQDEISDASKRALETYFLERANLYQRAALLMAEDVPGPSPATGANGGAGTSGPDPERWMDRCIVTDTPIEALEEYQLIGHCVGREMLMTHLPLVIGHEAMNEIMQRLSRETRDRLGGFQEEHFGPPEMPHDLPVPIFA